MTTTQRGVRAARGAEEEGEEEEEEEAYALSGGE